MYDHLASESAIDCAGKSLCFQIPALLTRKIVIVISPLISLMRDQCLKLAKHGISACFLGSGQPDKSVQCKAMTGVYRIVYVCPETILRYKSFPFAGFMLLVWLILYTLIVCNYLHTDSWSHLKGLQKILGLHYLQLMKSTAFLSGAMIFDLTTGLTTCLIA